MDHYSTSSGGHYRQDQLYFYVDKCIRSLFQIADGCPKLEVLRLDHCCRVSDVGLKAVATSCHQLQYLSLDQCTKVSISTMMWTFRASCIPHFTFRIESAIGWLIPNHGKSLSATCLGLYPLEGMYQSVKTLLLAQLWFDLLPGLL